MIHRLFIYLLILFGVSANASAIESDQRSKFIIGTHYYGFQEYSWPINYLNAVKKKDVDPDLAQLKTLGFNSIALLASWGEFEPVIGKPNALAYEKINYIIKRAALAGLRVQIRLPYLWSSLAEDSRERLSLAIVEHQSYRSDFRRFLNNFQTKVIKNNGNVDLIFGSWEDFYAIRDLFFEAENKAGVVIRNSFAKDTGINPGQVIQNGLNFEVFLKWMDAKIGAFIKVIPSYGYEVRVDSDRIEKNGKIEWFSHGSTYNVGKDKQLITYWAPYFGAKNNGETLKGIDAAKSFNWMFDLISAEVPTAKPFVDQFNFYDNSPGTETNAKIGDDQYVDFFNRASKILLTRSSGYSLWAVRDYRHNLVVNPAFSEGEFGWQFKNVKLRDYVVTITTKSQLAHTIPRSRLLVLKATEGELVIDTRSGAGWVEFPPQNTRLKFGLGRTSIKVNIAKSANRDGDLKLTIHSDSDNTQLNSISFYGHKQVGNVFSENGDKGFFYDSIKSLNFDINKELVQPCAGFGTGVLGEITSKGVFSDRWTSPEFALCTKTAGVKSGLKVDYLELSETGRSIEVIDGQSKAYRIQISKGVGFFQICGKKVASRGDSIRKFAISSVMEPKMIDASSKDERKLGLFIKNVTVVDCLKNQ